MSTRRSSQLEHDCLVVAAAVAMVRPQARGIEVDSLQLLALLNNGSRCHSNNILFEMMKHSIQTNIPCYTMNFDLLQNSHLFVGYVYLPSTSEAAATSV